MEPLRKPLEWHECEYLSVANAARVVGRSATWARAAICTGDLEAVRLPTGGPEVVSVKSLLALISRSRHLPKDEARRAKAGHLHLVIN